MSRCIMHIGMHKTGSTSIQSSLKGFSDDVFYYAEMPAGANHSLAMISMFSDNPGQHHLHQGKKPADIDKFISLSWKSLQKSIKLANGRTLLISGEGISRLSYDNIKAIYKYLSENFDEIQVVAYVRSPVGFMTSIFQESLKIIPRTNFIIESDYKNYRDIFGKFDDIFKLENVQLWKFDPKSFPEGCVVQDFCSRLGIALPKQNIVRVNESLSLQSVALLYIYRKFGLMFGSADLNGSESMKLGNAIKDIGNDRLRFSPEIFQPILKKKLLDIEWIENRLGQSFDEGGGQSTAHDIKNEADLIQVGMDVAGKLLQLVGRPDSDMRLIQSPVSVAYLVGQLRQKLANKAPDTFKLLYGNVGLVTTLQVSGWAIGINPHLPVHVKIKVNGQVVGEQIANLLRPGLKDSGFHPTGICGFSFFFPDGQTLSAGDVVTVEIPDGSFMLTNSPYTMN